METSQNLPLPTPPRRVVLTQISSVAWEHPADRAALQTLRSLPGFDEIVRKISSFIGERGVRHLFTANAVRVGPRQRPKLDALLSEVLATFDWDRRPQLYVTQTPIVNAMAVGFDDPFIVLNSATLRLLDHDEQREVLAHELGHIMSGHVTYSTIAVILLNFGLSNLPFLAGLAILPFQIALLEWYRKSELSCDRAGLLGVQDVNKAMMTYFKMAGGSSTDDELNLDEFLKQAAEYETTGSMWDNVLKVVNTAMRNHPFATVRVAELQRWVASGEYARILAGDYPKRGSEDDRDLKTDYAEAAEYYGARAKSALGELEGVVDRARDAFTSAFRGPKK
jgi:Zn-dependent protease with chaperone function